MFFWEGGEGWWEGWEHKNVFRQVEGVRLLGKFQNFLSRLSYRFFQTDANKLVFSGKCKKFLWVWKKNFWWESGWLSGLGWSTLDYLISAKCCSLRWFATINSVKCCRIHIHKNDFRKIFWKLLRFWKLTLLEIISS